MLWIWNVVNKLPSGIPCRGAEAPFILGAMRQQRVVNALSISPQSLSDKIGKDQQVVPVRLC